MAEHLLPDDPEDDEALYIYKLQPDDMVAYRGKQWIVVANPREGGGGFLLHHIQCWFNADELGDHRPNWNNPEVEYSSFSHYAHKSWCDLEDWESVYRFACWYFRIDTQGWLDKEVEHARAARKFRDASRALEKEIFPSSPDDFRGRIFTPGQMQYRGTIIAGELARRGILDPDGPLIGRSKLVT